MTTNELPAIMGTVLIVVGIAMVGLYSWLRTEGSDRSTQAGALLVVVGAFLLGLSLFFHHGGPRDASRSARAAITEHSS
jgi:hypothetical protein